MLLIRVQLGCQIWRAKPAVVFLKTFFFKKDIKFYKIISNKLFLLSISFVSLEIVNWTFENLTYCHLRIVNWRSSIGDPKNFKILSPKSDPQLTIPKFESPIYKPQLTNLKCRFPIANSKLTLSHKNLMTR